ncbi:hypothetical protein AC622_05935 [Bacillus sp. FJAT-27916]|nr:hypothetical protein AC622_05935 [Bacillus sp. FJAT-27916]
MRKRKRNPLRISLLFMKGLKRSIYSELLRLIGKICLGQQGAPPFSYQKNIGILKKVKLIPG